jgi:hypothetical protein
MFAITEQGGTHRGLTQRAQAALLFEHADAQGAARYPQRYPGRRKKVEMLFAHLKPILRMARLRLLGPCSARDKFLLAAIAQNLRRLAKLRPMRVPQNALAA